MSIYGGGEDWFIKYQEPNMKFKKLAQHDNMQRVLKLISLFKMCKYLTANHLNNSIYFQGNGTNLKRILGKYVSDSILLEHEVYNDCTKMYSVYSLGPQAYYLAKITDDQYYIQKHDLVTILKILSTNLLFMNMTRHSWVSAKYDTQNYPFLSRFEYIRKSHGAAEDNLDKKVSFDVLSIRKHGEDMGIIKSYIENNQDKQLYIIAHSSDLARSLNGSLSKSQKITWDAELLREKNEFDLEKCINN